MNPREESPKGNALDFENLMKKERTHKSKKIKGHSRGITDCEQDQAKPIVKINLK